MTFIRVRSEAVWRYVDAYFPRIFGLVFHTYLISRYGSSGYGLPGWVLGTLGICISLIPDPHAYILVRAQGQRAKRLLSLTTPALLVKILISVLISLGALYALPTKNLLTPHQDGWIGVFAGTALYGSTEFLWATLGTTSLACNNTRIIASAGIFARCLSLTILAILWATKISTMALDFFAVTMPVLISALILLPISTNANRILEFYCFSTRTYSIWSQAIALSTNLLFQFPLLIVGSTPGFTPNTTGHIAFISRILLAALQPFQILQSISIRNLASHQHPESHRRHKNIILTFKIGATCTLIAGTCLLLQLNYANKIGRDSLMISGAMLIGVSASIWYRHEQAHLLARPASIPYLVTLGYIPAAFISFVAATFSANLANTNLFALSIIFGWIAVSCSWKWVSLLLPTPKTSR
ncbi:hypothetical protein [Aquabacterium sp.]|uniref:hypothetical protein n=1 Tax=Aquabacterium sp. TaxID=1872578 RepID=UPI0035ADC44B